MKNTRFVRLCSTALILLVLCGIACPASAAIGDGGIGITPPEHSEGDIIYTSTFLEQPTRAIRCETMTKEFYGDGARNFQSHEINPTTCQTDSGLIPDDAPNHSNFSSKINSYNLVDSETPAMPNFLTVPETDPEGVYGVNAYFPGRSIDLKKYIWTGGTSVLSWSFYLGFAPTDGASYYYPVWLSE